MSTSKPRRRKVQDLGYVYYDGKPMLPVALWIDIHCKSYEKTKNPLDLMEAFTASVQAGVHPPQEILKPLAAAFQNVLEGDGAASLDRALGLTKGGPGGWGAFTRQRKENAARWRAAVLHSLTVLHGETIDDAAARLSYFLEGHPALKFSTGEGLAKSFTRDWKTRFHLDHLDPAYAPLHTSWTPAEREIFKQTFPRPIDTEE